MAFRKLVLSGLAALVLGGWTHGSSTSTSTVPSSFFCMHEQLGFGDPGPNAALIYSCLGKGTSVGWSNVQSTEAGSYDWSRNDLYVNRAIALGSEYFVDLSSIPSWARPPLNATTTAATTSGTTVTLSSADISKIVIGGGVSGTNIPSGAYIASKPTSTTFTLSAAVTSTGIANGATLTFLATQWATTQTTTPGARYTSGDDAMSQFYAALCNRYKGTVNVIFEMGNEISESGGATAVNRGTWLVYRDGQIALAALQANGCSDWKITTPSLYPRETDYQSWFTAANDDPAGNGVNIINAIANGGYLTIHGYGPANFYTNLLTPENWFVMRVNTQAAILWGSDLQAIVPVSIASRPLFNSEASWGTDGPGGAPSVGTGTPDRPKQAAFLARSLLINWAAGVKRYYWYTLTGGNAGNPGTSNWGQIELQNGSLVTAGTAWVNVRQWMLGAYQASAISYTNTGNPVTSGNGVWSVAFGRTSPVGYFGLAIWDVGTLNTTTGSYGGSSTYVVPSSPAYIGYCQIDGTWTAVAANDNVTIDMTPKFFETTRRSC